MCVKAVESSGIPAENELGSQVQLSQRQSEIVKLTNLEVSYTHLKWELQAKEEELKTAQTKLKEQIDACNIQLAETAQQAEEQKQKLSVACHTTVELLLRIQKNEVKPVARPI